MHTPPHSRQDYEMVVAEVGGRLPESGAMVWRVLSWRCLRAREASCGVPGCLICSVFCALELNYVSGFRVFHPRYGNWFI